MWRVYGASVQGTSHKKGDVPCQDAHAYHVLPRGELVAAAADGAGSGERSQEGSRAAVQRAVDLLAAAVDSRPPWNEMDWEDVMRGAFQEARAALVEIAGGEDGLRPLSTTLVCAVVSKGSLVVGQIGDSIAVARSEEGELSVPILPQAGEFAGETFFLTMPGALDVVEVEIALRPPRSLALTSDGLARLAFKLPGYEPSTRFFDPLWAFAAEAEDEAQANEDLAAFLDSERVCARADDDKTLVLATRSD